MQLRIRATVVVSFNYTTVWEGMSNYSSQVNVV